MLECTSIEMLSKWSPMSQLSMQNNLLGVLLVGGVCKQQNYAMFTNWRQIYELLGHNSGPKKSPRTTTKSKGDTSKRDHDKVSSSCKQLMMFVRRCHYATREAHCKVEES